MNPDPAVGDLLADSSAHVRVVPADRAEASSWLPTDRPSAVARAGVRTVIEVRVAADEVVAEPIVVNLTGSAAANYGHVDVRVGRHAKATVVVVHDATVDASGSIVTQVGDGADLTMLSIIDGPPEHVHLWQWHADVGRDARFVGSVVTLGGRVVRIMPSVSYLAPGGSAELLGAFLADGPQYLEHRIFVNHEQPHCSSNVVYKGALSGEGAHTVWIGDVLVRREAVGIDTYELNRNLLLDDGPRADSVPNLELETGDVASAGHASATGRFDDEQLFYLQSRGITETLARQLVVRGFFVDVLGRIPSTQWRDLVLDRISNRLGMTASAVDDEVGALDDGMGA
jgi:Fe-S cluster assembly protein SufD